MTVDEAAAAQAYKLMEDAPSLADWEHLHKKRFVVPNSYDFLLKSECVHSEIELLQLACQVLIAQCNHFKDHHLSMSPSDNTIEHCVDIIHTGSFVMFDTLFERNGDYSIGKMLEHVLFQNEAITYVSYLKTHPHALHGILRVASPHPVDNLVLQACTQTIQLLTHLQSAFAQL
jgi:DNA-directed RNA polymerase subunit L